MNSVRKPPHAAHDAAARPSPAPLRAGVPSHPSEFRAVPLPLGAILAFDGTRTGAGPCESCGQPGTNYAAERRFFCRGCLLIRVLVGEVEPDPRWLRRIRAMTTTPSDDGDGAELVRAADGDVVDPRFRGMRLHAVLAPPPDGVAGDLAPDLLTLPGSDRPRSLRRARVWPAPGPGSIEVRRSPDGGEEWGSEGFPNASAATQAMGRFARQAPRRGRPRLSGASFQSPDEFLDVVEVAVAGLRTQRRSPTLPNVAQFLGTHGDLYRYRCNPRTLQRWVRRAGYASWDELIESIP